MCLAELHIIAALYQDLIREQTEYDKLNQPNDGSFVDDESKLRKITNEEYASLLAARIEAIEEQIDTTRKSISKGTEA